MDRPQHRCQDSRSPNRPRLFSCKTPGKSYFALFYGHSELPLGIGNPHWELPLGIGNPHWELPIPSVTAVKCRSYVEVAIGEGKLREGKLRAPAKY